MKTLPLDLKEYKRTPIFNASTVPNGLLKKHSTKKGTWGLLTIESGNLVYVIDDESDKGTHRLKQGDQAVIAPEQVHHLELPSSDVEFYVRFLK